jgi:hypothetical protein
MGRAGRCRVFSRKFWLHYRSLRLALDICVMLGAAALSAYLILHTRS